MRKVLKEIKNQRNIPQHNQSYKRQTTGNIIINRDQQKELLLKLEISQECVHSVYSLHIGHDSLAKSIIAKERKKSITKKKGRKMLNYPNLLTM